MLKFGDGSGYCDIARAWRKYTSGFWQTGANILLGSTPSGPFAGTSAIRITRADPLFYATAVLDQQGEWIVQIFIKPVGIVSTRTFLMFQDQTAPNIGTQFVVQITPGGKIVISTGFGTNVYVFPSTFAAPNPSFPNGIFATSSAACPSGQWSHLCLKIKFASFGAGGRARLWVNGSLDLDKFGATNPTSRNSANWIVLTWASTDGSEISFSQFLAADTNGSQNNAGPFDPSTQISTIFPIADGVRRGWSPVPAWSKVNENPGPDDSASFVTYSTLGFPDGTFQIPGMSTKVSNLGVFANYALKGSGQAANGLVVPSGGSPVSLGTLVAPASWETLQSVSEVNPLTGQAWTDAEIVAAAWGIRGGAVTGQELSQFFLEKVWRSGLGNYAY